MNTPASWMKSRFKGPGCPPVLGSENWIIKFKHRFINWKQTAAQELRSTLVPTFTRRTASSSFQINFFFCRYWVIKKNVSAVLSSEVGDGVRPCSARAVVRSNQGSRRTWRCCESSCHLERDTSEYTIALSHLKWALSFLVALSRFVSATLALSPASEHPAIPPLPVVLCTMPYATRLKCTLPPPTPRCPQCPAWCVRACGCVRACVLTGCHWFNLLVVFTNLLPPHFSFPPTQSKTAKIWFNIGQLEQEGGKHAEAVRVRSAKYINTCTLLPRHCW